ncbi:MAG: AMP-dependent synthetase, partial [Hyphomicrobiales bacterium]
MNPAEWLVRSAARTPEGAALMHGRSIIATYGEFARAAASIGAALRDHGLEPGARAAIFMGNSTAYLEALYGIWFAGAAAVPINAKLHPREAAWIIGNADAKIVLTTRAMAAELAALSDEATDGEGPAGTAPEIIAVDSAAFAALHEAEPLPAPAGMDRDDLAWLFYTSGTTGRPKGVMITCGNLTAMSLSYFADVDEVGREDAILYAAPMSHGAGLYNFMHVLRGCRHVVPDSGGFDAEEILDLAPRIGPVSMFAAPTMVRRLVDAAEASGRNGEGIKTIVYAGGPMYEADILRAVKVMGPRFVQIYGQGECPMCITALPRADVADRSHPNWRARLNSVGMAQSVVRVKIAGEDGAELARGDSGEILVRGAPVMAGYWHDEPASRAALRDGWLHTGDIGRMDEDGYVSLIDRSKDMIISGGSNIYPREVEEVLLAD